MVPFVNLCLFFREFCPGNPEWKRANEAKIVATLLKIWQNIVPIYIIIRLHTAL